ncbi:unnamed protein product [Lota lota]
MFAHLLFLLCLSSLASSNPLNRRAIRFEPAMLDFSEHPVGMLKMEKVHLHNPGSEEISLISISGSTAHFHASFFKHAILPPGGMTSFDVVFLARVVGNIENTLFINTSHHGLFTYQVFGVSVPNLYRLRPFTVPRGPVDDPSSPLMNLQPSHSQPLQVVEMYSSGGNLHLELPTGQHPHTEDLWEVPPFEKRASFVSRYADNHMSFLGIRPTAPSQDQSIVLLVEPSSAAPAIYSSKEVLDFGTLRAQDRPRTLKLLLNSGTEDVRITSVRTSPPNKAISVDFKGVTLKKRGYTQVASITFDPSKAARPDQSSGKITVKVKERSYSTLEIPYQADVLMGYLSFDDATTLFHIRSSPLDPVVRPIFLTNNFSYPVQILNASLKPDTTTMFTVQNLSSVVLPPQGSQYVFSLVFQPVRPSVLINSHVLLLTNLSRFHLPVLAYTGLLEPLVLPPSLQGSFLDFGVQSSTETSSITLVVINSNPIELEIKSWLVTGESFSIELLKTGRGNQTVVRGCVEELQKASASHQRTVILASGYYAAFRVSLIDNSLKGTYERAVHITTDYEILTIPVKALIVVGTISSCPKSLTLPPSFPGKVVHQSLIIQSSFRQPSELRQVVSLTQDQRFTHRRLRNTRTLEPRRRTKVANIYFDAGLQCGDDCYVGLPFVLKGESRPGGLVLQEDIWDEDVDLLQKLLGRWNDLVERSGHEIKAVFEVNSALQQNVRSEVTARLIWPSLLNCSHRVVFPLTNANSSSDEEVVLENPADVPVFVQLLPLALFPSPSVFAGKLADRLPWANLSNINIDTKTLEFHVHQPPAAPVSSGSGFLQVPAKSLVYNLLLQPGESKSFNVRFTPSSDHSVSSLLIVRNNLTVMDVLLLEGRGVLEHLRVGGKTPGREGYLRFKVTEALLRHCTNQTNLLRDHSLRRTFKVENAGVLPVHITSAQINRHACGGHGFTVVNCQEFIIQPNSSRELVILFTPDFSASRVIRELKLVTRGGSEFVFVLNASLPHHMLGACAKTLPRPAWEWDFCLLVSLVMSFMLLLVGFMAYLEACSQWETFRTHLFLEAGRETNSLPHSNDPHGPLLNSRGFYGSRGGASHIGGRHGNGRTLPDAGGTDRKSRAGGLCAVATWTTSSQPANGSASGSTQPANRKTQSGRQLSIVGKGEVEGQLGAVLPQKRELCAGEEEEEEDEEEEDTGLLEVLDQDEELSGATRPELIVNVQVKTKEQKKKKKKKRKKRKEEKKEEGEQEEEEEEQEEEQEEDEVERGKKVRTHGDKLKDLQDDDASSTTTDTSTTDLEASIREEPVRKKGRTVSFENREEETSDLHVASKTQKPGTPKPDSHSGTGTNRRDSQPGTGTNTRDSQSDIGTIGRDSQSGTGTPNRDSQSGTGYPRRDSQPTTASNLLPKLDHCFVSDEELDPPEWDLPLSTSSSQVATLQQISMQTRNTELFLKRAMLGLCSPPPGLPAPLPVDGYRNFLDTTSDETRRVPGARSTAGWIPDQIQEQDPSSAAVTASYDRSPGAPGTWRPENPARILTHTTSVDSYSSERSWTPLVTRATPNISSDNSFSAFGPSNSFNLTRVFKGINEAKKPVPQQSWAEPTTAVSSSSSIWDVAPSDPLTTWSNSCGSPTIPTTSIFTTSGNTWSTTGPFSSPIWSISRDPTLHRFTTPSNATPTAPEAPPSPGELSPTYNPWSMWRPMLSRRGSEPWPSPSHDPI